MLGDELEPHVLLGLGNCPVPHLPGRCNRGSILVGAASFVSPCKVVEEESILTVDLKVVFP